MPKASAKNATIEQIGVVFSENEELIAIFSKSIETAKKNETLKE